MIEIIPCDIILHITVGWKINPLSPVVSSAVLGSKVSTGEFSPVELPATVVGKDGKERAATKPKTQTPITSTTVNLTVDSLNDGVIAPGRSLYTFPSAKSVISELATAYNRILRGLTSWVGRLFPTSEAST